MNDQDRYLDILNDLRSIGSEQEWFEFKVNQSDPHMIGKYISALSNAAALNGKNTAFLIWGVENESLDLLGTKFNPYTRKRTDSRFNYGFHRD
ncbi:AlbA family DNA-binding domain-containing protein [Hellea balneolensis]|uniref:AlbA family DNA-binding domain-containing protein n=1 Tax=Hellea balneolensis TaxID=287478 RepID=UPI0006850C29|nr:RNA-binding domain-containing protein [Hellea balneolensis]